MLSNLLQHKGLLIKVAFMIVAFLIIQFFFIQPKKKEEETRNDFLKKLKIGMKVTTIGGLYGKIIKIDKHTVTLEIDVRGSSVTIKKQALVNQITQPTEKNK